MFGGNLMDTESFQSSSYPFDAADNRPVQFDRRQCQRHAIDGQVTIQRCAINPTVQQQPRCSLNLCDMSDEGIQAISDLALHPNEMVTIHFPPRGLEGGFDLPGHVVRCESDKHGYRIAIRFDCRRAA